jgi:hypothetical protein
MFVNKGWIYQILNVNYKADVCFIYSNIDMKVRYLRLAQVWLFNDVLRAHNNLWS